MKAQVGMCVPECVFAPMAFIFRRVYNRGHSTAQTIRVVRVRTGLQRIEHAPPSIASGVADAGQGNRVNRIYDAPGDEFVVMLTPTVFLLLANLGRQDRLGPRPCRRAFDVRCLSYMSPILLRAVSSEVDARRCAG